MRTMLKSKIHRARITGADLHYEGSITIDSRLMRRADLLPFEKVEVFDIDNGARFETYVIEGEEGTGTVQINGAAARLVQTGDLVIVVSYRMVADDEAARHRPKIIIVDEGNREITEH